MSIERVIAVGYQLAGFQMEGREEGTWQGMDHPEEGSTPTDGRIVVDELGCLYAVCNGRLIPCPESRFRIRSMILEDREAGKQTRIDFGTATGEE